MTNKHKGFTLLELLVVIGIIGILMSIASISYSSAQKRARDSRRMTDVKSIQNAMEQYYSDNSGSYPVAPAACADGDVTTCTAISAYFAGGIPDDPQVGRNYVISGLTASSYAVTATLENGTTYQLRQLQ